MLKHIKKNGKYIFLRGSGGLLEPSGPPGWILDNFEIGRFGVKLDHFGAC